MAGPEDRPVQHRIGDAAAHAVAAIWSGTGAAVEHVQRDYGEDLLVQPAIDGRTDPARIWVQVKGTDSARRDPHPLRVPNSKLLRWSRATDLIVVVSWNVRHSSGWYRTIGPSDARASSLAPPQGMTTIGFEHADVFDVEHAERLVREAVLAHADNELLLRRAWHEQRRADHGVADDDPAFVAIILSAMSSIGLIEENPDGRTGIVRREFLGEIRSRLAAATDQGPGADDDLAADTLLRVTAAAIRSFARAPIRSHLLEMMTLTVMTMLRPASGWPMPVPWE